MVSEVLLEVVQKLHSVIRLENEATFDSSRSEERRVGKECRL